jgi:hypothetical protein
VIRLQAWSSIVHTLIPNAAVLSKHLTTFAEACSATEVILFERTTFLVIATSRTSSPADPPVLAPDSTLSSLNPTRYERTSELIKAFKHSCSRVREEFHSLEMELADFTAVLDEMTRNTYVMVVVHDPTIGMCPLGRRDGVSISKVPLLCRNGCTEDEHTDSEAEVRGVAGIVLFHNPPVHSSVLFIYSLCHGSIPA